MMRWFATFAAAATVAVAGCNGSTTPPMPHPTTTPLMGSIQHVVVLVQENRSFNMMFMGYPGANTAAKGLCKPYTVSGKSYCTGGGGGSIDVPLKPIKLEGTGQLEVGDIEHDHAAFEKEYNGGKMDGFDTITKGTGGGGGPAGLYPYAYVEPSETKPYWDMARQYTLADDMFSTETSDSFSAHQQLIAGTTEVNANESLIDTPVGGFPWGCDAPTGTTTPVITTAGKVINNGFGIPCMTYKSMADVLDKANVSWAYYVRDYLPSDPKQDWSGAVWNAFDAIQAVACVSKRGTTCTRGPDWSKHVSMPNTNIFTDIRKGKLPEVSWVIPNLFDSDHPASGCNGGPPWVTSIVNAIGKSAYWRNTAIVVVWDDWGGWYDNVPPPQINYTSLGMRVPMLVISPWAQHGYVSHTQYDFGSILKFVEQNFGTGNLGKSDVTANSIGNLFDFTKATYLFKPFTSFTPLPCASNTFPSPGIRRALEHPGG